MKNVKMLYISVKLLQKLDNFFGFWGKDLRFCLNMYQLFLKRWTIGEYIVTSNEQGQRNQLMDPKN